MKWNRVNIGNDKEYQETVNRYLTQKYARQGKYEKIIKDYLEDDQEEYKTMTAEEKEFFIKGEASYPWDFLLNFSIGVKEVSFYLADCFFKGFGVTQSDDLAYITLMIGKKLGDQKSIDFLKGTPIPDTIEPIVNKCLIEIYKNKAEVGDRQLSWEEIAARAKMLDYTLKNCSGYSYYHSIKQYDNCSMINFCNFVQPVIENDQLPTIKSTAKHEKSEQLPDAKLTDNSFTKYTPFLIQVNKQDHYTAPAPAPVKNIIVIKAPEPVKPVQDSGITGFFKNLFSFGEPAPVTSHTSSPIVKMVQKSQPVFTKVKSTDSSMICDGHIFGSMREEIVNVNPPLTFKFNVHTVHISHFRSVTLPDYTNPGKTCTKNMALKYPNGNNISERDPAYFNVDYDINGKLIKLDIPNTPVVSSNPLFPVVVPYHGNLYTLPVNSWNYKHLVDKVYENHGTVTVGHADQAYHIEYLG